MTSATIALLDRLTPSPFTRPGEPAWMHEDATRAQAWLACERPARPLATRPGSTRRSPTFSRPLSRLRHPPATANRSMLGDGRPVGRRPRRVRARVRQRRSRPQLSRPGRLSRPASAAAGPLRVTSPAAMSSAPGGATADRRFDGFQALNQAAAATRAVVLVAPRHRRRRTDPRRPPVRARRRADRVAPAHRHRRRRRQPSSRVIETYAGLPGRGLTNAVTTIVVGRGAAADPPQGRRPRPPSPSTSRTRSIRQAAGSDVRSCSVMLGADIARNAIDVDSVGRRRDTSSSTGLYLPDRRHSATTTSSPSTTPPRACTSRQLFKGVVDDHARGSFSGRIIVRPGTVATDADQTSRNLLLAPTAQADTRPWLEIFADDVRCTHGATVGRLDDEALFYLRSRGIPERRGPHDAHRRVRRRDHRRRRPDALRRHLGHSHRREGTRTERRARHDQRRARAGGAHPRLRRPPPSPTASGRPCHAAATVADRAAARRQHHRAHRDWGAAAHRRQPTPTRSVSSRPAGRDRRRSEGRSTSRRSSPCSTPSTTPRSPSSIVELGLVYRCEESRTPRRHPTHRDRHVHDRTGLRHGRRLASATPPAPSPGSPASTTSRSPSCGTRRGASPHVGAARLQLGLL